MKPTQALALTVLLVACATLDATETFVVETEPSGAEVHTSSGLYCPSTPCTFENVRRDGEFTVTITKEGYRSTTHHVAHRPLAGDNAFPGGAFTTPAQYAHNASIQQLAPNPLRVVLQRAAAPAAPPALPADGDQ
jgi:hypothetical protein